MTTITFQVVIGTMLVGLGEWGVRQAVVLVPSQLGEEECEHRRRVLRRGGRTCQFVGVIFVLMIVPLWL